LDLGTLPRVADGTGDTPKEIGADVSETEQRSSPITGHMSAGESGLDDPSAETWNRQLNRGTIWHGGASF